MNYFYLHLIVSAVCTLVFCQIAKHAPVIDDPEPPEPPKPRKGGDA